ncbi:glycosyltransferase family 4 protein [Sphingomonas ginsengisoli (ex An et al. 2013)]|nr:glycosyltransferase family 4 protein [Sphingomonas ginsengisoli An et al. 2013]
MSVASGLASHGHAVTLFGAGHADADTSYAFARSPLIARERFERFPKVPVFRGDTTWEEATFLPGFLRRYRPQDFDVTLTCSYPFLNWALRARKHRGYRPRHVFVTQNGDWPARANNSEYRFFGCDGLVAINPDYFEDNRANYRTALIPNGVDLTRFNPGPAQRAAFGLPEGVPLVLMVSAMIASKRVGDGIEAVARLPGVHLVVAGDGPLRDELRAKADALMPGRYHTLSVAATQMPDLYRSADVFLHLSRDESFGNVYVEAMASGLPSVAWDLPRTRWIMGDTGVLVTDLDQDALVAGIQRALTLPRAPAAQLERAERFSWTAIAADYERFLKEVVAAGPQRPE